jgi:hypothetical protein
VPDARDPTALVRHAAQAGDWRLVELLARVIAGGMFQPSSTARRAYGTLVMKLGLRAECADYDRR